MGAHQIQMGMLAAGGYLQIGRYICQIQFNCNTVRMLSVMYRQGLYLFSSSKYHVVKGKYLVPVPPKKPVSSYFIYANETRNSIEGADIGEKAKKTAAQWSQLTEEQKKAFSQKAEALKKQYEPIKEDYTKKYVTPFQSVSDRLLIMKDFYASYKAKFGEGFSKLNEHISNLTEQAREAYQKKAKQIAEERDRLKKQFEIPTLKYKTFSAYLKNERAKNPAIPATKDISPSDLKVYQAKYDQEVKEYQRKFKKFASSFNLQDSELAKIIKQSKGKIQVKAEEAKEALSNAKQAAKKGTESLKKNKRVLTLQARKIRAQFKRTAEQKIKKVAKELEKKNKQAQKLVNKSKTVLAKVLGSKSEDIKEPVKKLPKAGTKKTETNKEETQ